MILLILTSLDILQKKTGLQPVSRPVEQVYYLGSGAGVQSPFDAIAVVYFGQVPSFMFVVVILSVMYKFFGHIHSVVLIWSNDYSSLLMMSLPWGGSHTSRFLKVSKRFAKLNRNLFWLKIKYTPSMFSVPSFEKIS